MKEDRLARVLTLERPISQVHIKKESGSVVVNVVPVGGRMK